MHIDVKYRFIWGRELFYPINDDAKFLAKFAKCSSFTLNQIRQLIERGIKVTVLGTPLSNDFFEIPKMKVEIVADDPKDQKIATQMSEIVNYFDDSVTLPPHTE